jgi:uncharacterized protein YlxP (DUF503 family)
LIKGDAGARRQQLARAANDMVIGTLRVELAVYESTSLKDKRRIIKSLKDRLAHQHNISVAEVDALESRQRAVLGMAMVSNDRRFTESCLSKIVDQVRAFRQTSLLNHELEIW